MKYYLSLIMLSLTLLWTGCSDDDDAPFVGVTIVSADTDFNAAGGSGTIVYECGCAGALTATSDKDWLLVNTPGNGTVTYTVAVNDDFESRTAQVALTAGGDTQIVSVTQLGSFYNVQQTYAIGAKATRTAFDFYTNRDNVTVTSDADWMTAEIENNQLVIHTQPNTGVVRTATLTFRSSWKTVTAEVVQDMDYYAYFQGEWKLRYTDSEGKPAERVVMLLPAEEEQSYVLSGLEAEVLVNYDPATHQMSLTAQLLGTIQSYLLYWLPFDVKSSYFTSSNKVGFDLTYNGDAQQPAILFADNGVWGDYPVNSFLFGLLTADGDFAGSVAQYANPTGLYR